MTEQFDWESYKDEVDYATYDPDDDKVRIYCGRVSREMYDALKAARFNRAYKQGCFYAKWYPTTEDIALTLCGEIVDEDTSLFDRAEERAGRFATYSVNAHQRAEQAIRAGNDAVAGIPFGQPILVGHHSERKHRRAVEKAQREAQKTVEEVDRRDYWKRRASGVLRHANHKVAREPTMRRIKKLEANQRKQVKERDGAKSFLKMWSKEGLDLEGAIKIANYDHLYVKLPNPKSDYEGSTSIWSALRDEIIDAEEAAHIAIGVHSRSIAHHERWIEHIDGQIEYWKTLLQDKHDENINEQLPLKKGVWIRCSYGWAQVQRVNRGAEKRITSVSVVPETAAWYKGKNTWFYPRIVEYESIQEHKTDVEYKEMTYADKHQAEMEKRERVEKHHKDDDLRKAAETRIKAVNGVEIKVNWNPDYFATPLDVVEIMLNEIAHVLPVGGLVLEPSAGDGRIIKRIVNRWPGTRVHWCEINTTARELLIRYTQETANVNQVGTDFLDLEPGNWQYDVVVMNPPFGNRAYVKHVMHAYKFLKPGGLLVTVLPAEARYHIDQDNDKFRAWVKEGDKFHGSADLGFGAFKESGTEISTHILVLRKQEDQPRLF